MRNIEGVRQTKYYYDSFYEVWLVRRNLMQCIYLFTPQEAEIVVNSRQSSWSTPWVVFLSPSLRMITLKNPYFFPPADPTNYDKATYIVSSNLCLFTCSQATGFPWNPYPQRHISAKRVFLKFIPMFDVNFSNNISIPSQYIKKIEHDTTFEIS